MLALTVVVMATLLFAFFSKMESVTVSLKDCGFTKKLLIFAHPDDESMFFAPFITTTTTTPSDMSLLCMSIGDADGLGSVRAGELVKAASQYGISPIQVTVWDDPNLQDAMDVYWNISYIAAKLNDHIKLEDQLDIITFDEGGVSGHANHIAVSNGILEWYSKLNTEKQNNIRVWQLESVPIYLKYTSFIEKIYFNIIGKTGCLKTSNRTKIIGTTNGFWKAVEVMKTGHVSQMVWFRYGWLFLSQYMTVNNLIRVR